MYTAMTRRHGLIPGCYTENWEREMIKVTENQKEEPKKKQKGDEMRLTEVRKEGKEKSRVSS